jgi:mannose-6-phosphate isomerase-like protein (cupin superfamily)
VVYSLSVVKQGDVYENPRSGTRLEIRELSPERLSFERRYPPATGRAQAHLHLDFTQRWEVASGMVTVAVDGEARRLEPGQSMDLPVGTKHQDPYNESPTEAVVRWRIEPVTAFIEAFLNSYAYLLREDQLNAQDEFPTLQLFVILSETQAQSYAASLPVGLQRATLPLLGAIGRLRGYRLREPAGR